MPPEKLVDTPDREVIGREAGAHQCETEERSASMGESLIPGEGPGAVGQLLLDQVFDRASLRLLDRVGLGGEAGEQSQDEGRGHGRLRTRCAATSADGCPA